MDARTLLAAVQQYVEEQLGRDDPVEVQIHFPTGRPWSLPMPDRPMTSVARTLEPAEPSPPPSKPAQLLTLAQMAAWVHHSKRSLQRILPDLPPPVIKGTDGRASYWSWQEVRPRLEKIFLLSLPEQLPEIHRRL